MLAALDTLLKARGIEHFSAHEITRLDRVAPNGVRNVMPTAELWPNIIPTLQIAEFIREKIGGKPIVTNSGYRYPLYNAAVGGGSDSLHMRFNALDLAVPDPAAVAALLAAAKLAPWMGVGVYPSFIHIDTRGLVFGMKGARW